MKRGLLLSVTVLLLLTACKTGPLKDIRLGKTYGLFVPRKVAIHRAPMRNAETFKLEEAEAFIVEDVMCEEGMGTASCWFDLATSMENHGNAGVAFYKVRFESGKEGYINALYFYPKLADGIISEESAKALGKTPQGFVLETREKIKEGRAAIIEEENNRKSFIESAPWPEDIKKLVLDNKLKIGMTIEQVMLSKNPSERPAFKQFRLRKASETVTEGGVIEKWVFRDYFDKTMKTLYFRDGRLTRWETTAR